MPTEPDEPDAGALRSAAMPQRVMSLFEQQRDARCFDAICRAPLLFHISRFSRLLSDALLN